MRITKLTIRNFRSVKSADLYFDGHTLLIGGNNVGKSTVCEALDLVLGPDRLRRFPPVEEFDFRNAGYLEADGNTLRPIRIEAILTDLTEEITSLCANNLQFWHKTERRLLGEGEVKLVDTASVEPCLTLVTIAKYDIEEDEFTAKTVYGTGEETEDERKPVPSQVKRSIGFLYLRAIRTGSRALSLERGTLLDNILRMKEARKGIWESIRARLSALDPPIDAEATDLAPILAEIEERLSEYISPGGTGRSTRLFVSQLTREHLRKTVSFFLTMGENETPIPFQNSGTGTLNTLVLALLTFIADIKKKNVIFAMEEPEIALPPHTQRRIASYLLTQTSQCFVTSHSPYVIEHFEPDAIIKLRRSTDGVLTGQAVKLPATMKAKNYRQNFRRSLAEAMLCRAVIIGEGMTERDLLLAAAQKMETADKSLFPLDVSGLCVIEVEGDGNLQKMGEFFKALDIPAFAFFDKMKRTTEQLAKLAELFAIKAETDYKSAEKLMATECPLDRQWAYLEGVRQQDTDGSFCIPAVRPADDTLRKLTTDTLKGQKGDGGAAALLELCTREEMPKTVVDFLSAVYAKYPRPKPKAKPTPENGYGPDEGKDGTSPEDWLSVAVEPEVKPEGT